MGSRRPAQGASSPRLVSRLSSASSDFEASGRVQTAVGHESRRNFPSRRIQTSLGIENLSKPSIHLLLPLHDLPSGFERGATDAQMSLPYQVSGGRDEAR